MRGGGLAKAVLYMPLLLTSLSKLISACPPSPAPPPHPLQIYNSPSISEELLAEVKAGMWRVHSSFDRHFRTFLALLPAQAHLDLRFFLSRFDVQDAPGGGDAPGPL